MQRVPVAGPLHWCARCGTLAGPESASGTIVSVPILVDRCWRLVQALASGEQLDERDHFGITESVNPPKTSVNKS